MQRGRGMIWCLVLFSVPAGAAANRAALFRRGNQDCCAGLLSVLVLVGFWDFSGFPSGYENTTAPLSSVFIG